MSKVVYLMGAGASFGKREKDSNGKNIPGKILEGLPIVNEIPERLEYVKSLFAKQNVQEYKEAQQVLIKDFEWLIENTRRHATIDTFAKKLFLTNQKDEYIKVKRLLSLFFKTEQLINRPDGRYDTFLASVLQKNDKGKLRISDDITILTWNYDSQFEIAYKEYLSTGDYQETIDFPEQLGIDINTNLRQLRFSSDHSQSPQIFKINGSASFISDYSMGRYYSYNDGILKEKWASELLKTYISPFHPDGTPMACMLNFAWENTKAPEYIKRLDDIVYNLESLVIIGYTFPFFNREIDTLLFEFIRRNVQTVYIQDPNANNIKESVLNIFRRTGIHFNEKKIVLKNDVEQFFLPPEL